MKRRRFREVASQLNKVRYCSRGVKKRCLSSPSLKARSAIHTWQTRPAASGVAGGLARHRTSPARHGTFAARFLWQDLRGNSQARNARASMAQDIKSTALDLAL